MLKDLLLQKGWAGKTISREETVDRLNPIIRSHIAVNRSHDVAIRSHGSDSLRQSLDQQQTVARTNVGKLAETVYSCGGVAYSGTDTEPSDFVLPDTDSAQVEKLLEMERALLDQLVQEKGIEHHMRTRAVLSAVSKATEERIEVLEAAKR